MREELEKPVCPECGSRQVVEGLFECESRNSVVEGRFIQTADCRLAVAEKARDARGSGAPNGGRNNCDSSQRDSTTEPPMSDKEKCGTCDGIGWIPVPGKPKWVQHCPKCVDGLKPSPQARITELESLLASRDKEIERLREKWQQERAEVNGFIALRGDKYHPPEETDWDDCRLQAIDEFLADLSALAPPK